MTVPAEVQIGKISSSSYSGAQAGQSKLKYHFPLKFKSPGTYRLGPVDLTYRPRSGQISSNQTTRNPGLDFVLPNQPFYNSTWVLGLSLLGIILFLYFALTR